MDADIVRLVLTVAVLTAIALAILWYAGVTHRS